MAKYFAKQNIANISFISDVEKKALRDVLLWKNNIILLIRWLNSDKIGITLW